MDTAAAAGAAQRAETDAPCALPPPRGGAVRAARKHATAPKPAGAGAPQSAPVKRIVEKTAAEIACEETMRQRVRPGERSVREEGPR